MVTANLTLPEAPVLTGNIQAADHTDEGPGRQLNLMIAQLLALQASLNIVGVVHIDVRFLIFILLIVIRRVKLIKTTAILHVLGREQQIHHSKFEFDIRKEQRQWFQDLPDTGEETADIGQ